jgi:hypothetical protein
MRNKPIQADQLIPTSATPPPEAGFYRVDRNTIGVVGNMVFRDPRTQKIEQAVVYTVDIGRGIETLAKAGVRIGLIGDSTTFPNPTILTL